MLDKTIEAIKNVQSRIQDMKEDKQNNKKKSNTETHNNYYQQDLKMHVASCSYFEKLRLKIFKY